MMSILFDVWAEVKEAEKTSEKHTRSTSKIPSDPYKDVYLKLCPFCGADAMVMTSFSRNTVAIRCTGCSANVWSSMERSSELNISVLRIVQVDWNRRIA